MLVCWAAYHAVNRAVFQHAFGASDDTAGQATAYMHAVVTFAFAAACAGVGRPLSAAPPTPFENAIIEHSLAYFLVDTVQILLRWKPSKLVYVVHHVCSATNLTVVWVCGVAAPSLVLALLAGEGTNPLARADSVYIQRHGYSDAARFHPNRLIVRGTFFALYILMRALAYPVLAYYTLQVTEVMMPPASRTIFLVGTDIMVLGGLAASAHIVRKVVGRESTRKA